MFPTLYHFLFGTFDLEIDFLRYFNSFGLFVAFAFLIAKFIFSIEIKRKTDLGFIAYKTNTPSPQEHVSVIMLIAIVFGFLGAKIFAWLENPIPLSEFLADPFNGLTIYGGLIFAFFISFFYLKWYKMPVLQFMDAVAPALMLAYGVGRLGCHVSGDGDWGIVNKSIAPNWVPEWLWSYSYPNNVLGEGVLIPDCIYNDYCYQLLNPVYPTPLYETIVSTLFFILLWKLRPKVKKAGQLFFIYLFLNGIERFFIEKIRVNEFYSIVGWEITQAEIISVTFMLIGVFGFLRLRKKSSN